MSTLTVPAIRGAIGRTDYFIAKVPARQLGAIVVPASEMREWKNWGFNRIQRAVDLARIRKELGPYLVRSKDRFYGSLIVTVMEPDVFEFESLSKFADDLPAATRKNMASVGQLSMHGGKFVALDGQHRLVALREIVAGRLEAGAENADAVGDDEVCVMFIQHESLERTRRIFNKVNRHAKPTTPNDNIITSEDDGYAIVTRWLMGSPPLDLEGQGPNPPLAIYDHAGALLVEWEKLTPKASDGKLTTLNAVYKTVQTILAAHGVRDFDEKSRVNRPPNNELLKAYTHAAEWWAIVLEEVNGLRIAKNNPHLIKRMWPWTKDRSLLFRPLGLVGLFRGLSQACQAGLGFDEAVERANQLPWRASNELWCNVIIGVNGRVLKSETNVNLMARLVCYMIAPGHVSSEFKEELARALAEARGEAELFDGDSPEGYLPSPVV